MNELLSSVWAAFLSGVAAIFFTILAGCASVEPHSSVWVMAGFGAFGSVLRGQPRGVIVSFSNWVVGVFFAIAWTVGIDHFQPESEAFFVGLASGEASKTWINQAGIWGGAILSRHIPGSARNVP